MRAPAPRAPGLFPVGSPDGSTGHGLPGWFYVSEDNAWKLAGGSEKRLVKLPAGGVLDETIKQPATIDVRLTTADLGPTAVLPTVPTASKVTFESGAPGVRFDPRPPVLRLPSARAPSGRRATRPLPPPPTPSQCGSAHRPAPFAKIAVG